MDNETPTVSPVVLLFRSRKFVASLIGLILDLLIVLLPPDVAPQIAPFRGQLITVVTIMMVTVIGGIAFEDGKEKSAPAPGTMSAQMSVSSTPSVVSSPEGAPAADEPRYTPYDAPGYSPPHR